MKTINGYLVAISVVLAVIFFYVGLTKNVIRLEEFIKRPTVLFGVFLRLLLAEAIVYNGLTLTSKILEIVQGCIEGISNLFEGLNASSGILGNVPVDLYTLAQGSDFGSSIGVWVLSIIGCGLIWCASMIMLLTVYLRFFRIYIYAAISPIPLATMGSELTSRTSRSFLMNYMGLCLQGVVIAIALIIFEKVVDTGFVVDMSKTAGSNLFDYVGTILLQLFLLVIMVRASDKYIKEMIGG